MRKRKGIHDDTVSDCSEDIGLNDESVTWSHVKIGAGGFDLGKNSGGLIIYRRENVVIPEKYKKINELASSVTGRPIAFRMEEYGEVGFNSVGFEEEMSAPGYFEKMRAAEKLLEEFKYLTEDAFFMQGDVSREVIYNAFYLYFEEFSSKLMALQKKSYLGGLVSKYKNAENQNPLHLKVGAEFDKLVAGGNTRKQAVLILVERYGRSERTIERDLKKYKESTDKS